MQKPTVLVIGASLKPERYSNICIRSLSDENIAVEAIGLVQGHVGNVMVRTGKPGLINIHTVSLYLAASRQPEYYQYILQLKPARVIFNPGAENEEFMHLLMQNHIDCMEACSILMVRSGIFFEIS